LLVGNTIALGSAITYDKMVNAIGPFELTEYLGLALVWLSARGDSAIPRGGCRQFLGSADLVLDSFR
jgi:hypothetical protein